MGCAEDSSCLEREGYHSPAVSTVHEILRRTGRIKPPTGGAEASQRFEMPAPNLLWQMDFKGGFGSARAQCHPLTVVDDHSRYDRACRPAPTRTDTVRSRLETTFAVMACPRRSCRQRPRPGVILRGNRWTRLGVWLVDSASRYPSRPSSAEQGKKERFHRTLKAEVFACDAFAIRGVTAGVRRLAGGLQPRASARGTRPAGPGERYRPSPRSMPDDCRRPNTTAMRSCDRAKPQPRTTSTSKAAYLESTRRPSEANGSPSAPQRGGEGKYGVFFASPPGSPASI